MFPPAAVIYSIFHCLSDCWSSKTGREEYKAEGCFWWRCCSLLCPGRWKPGVRALLHWGLWMVAAMLSLLPFSAQAEHRAVWWSSEFCHGGSKWSRTLWAAGSTSLANLHTLWCSCFHPISNSRLGSSLSLLPFSHSILLHKSWAILVDPLGSTKKKSKWTRTT